MLNNGSNAYLGHSDINNLNLSTRGNDFKMVRNDSTGSNAFAKKIRGADSYLMESPDIGPRKVNQKAGVQLAPLNTNNVGGVGRSSLMSIKGEADLDPNQGSHPILRVHNYRKPQLEKLMPKENAFNNIERPFQAAPDPHPSVLNSRKMIPRKRDNAQLAPLNRPLDGTNS